MPPHRRREHHATRRKRNAVPTIPDPGNINAVADWAEFYLLVIQQTLSRATLKRYLEQTAATESGFDLDGIWQELERRCILYGTHPPFTVEKKHLQAQITWKNRPEYMMCILLSLLGNGEESVATGSLFEEISEKIICRYLGANSIPYGRTRPALKTVAAKLNEKFIQEPNENFNDRGVDVIAWKPFEDSRPSQLILLLQCASGWNWRRKTRDIPYRAWLRYIHWGTDPVIGFTMPGIFPRNVFDDVAVEAGLIFDRARFYQNYVPDDLSRSLKKRMTIWSSKKIPAVFRR